MKSRCSKNALIAIVLATVPCTYGPEAAGERAAIRITGGSLRFEERVIWDQGKYIFGISSADLDGDGDPDLTCSDAKSNVLVWYENDGHGNLTRRVIGENDPGLLERHAVGDVNGDGHPDVVIVKNNVGHLLWFENSGTPKDGKHWTRHVITTSFMKAYDVALSDLDGDGDLDVGGSAFRGDLFAWFENPGPAGLSKEWAQFVFDRDIANTRTVVAADINRDGRPDLVGTATFGDLVAWYENTGEAGEARFRRHDIDREFVQPGQGHAVDLDTDGDLDVIMAYGMRVEAGETNSHKAAWYENVGRPGDGVKWERHVVGSVLYGFEAVTGDLDGDGDLDIVATGCGGGKADKGEVCWFENPGDPKGRWKKGSLRQNWEPLNQVIVVDLDQDGRLDFAACSEQGSFYWWKNLGPTPAAAERKGMKTDPATFELTRDGQPRATIVLAERASVSAGFAAAELQLHVSKITGATLPIVNEPLPVNGPAILIGESEATRRLGLRSEDFNEQEYLVRIAPDALVLMGRDGAAGEERTLRAKPEWIEGRFGKALRFDGVNDGLRADECGFDDAVGSLECWVRLGGEVQEEEGTLLRLDGGGPWTYHILRRIAGTDRIGYYVNDGAATRNVVSDELGPGWHHVLATHDVAADKAELFVDGALQGAMPYPGTACAGGPLLIGGYHHGSDFGNSLRGDLDEIRISRCVRAPGQDAGGGPYEADAATTFLAHFDEGRGVPIQGLGFPGSYALPDLFDANGTLYAVYDVLERQCGVRWYAPGETGTVLPVTKDLVVSGPERRRRPAMRHRWITPTRLYLPTPEQVVPSVEVDLWKLRMRIGGEPFWTCHSFGGYHARLGDAHPEFFAKGYDGGPPQMCYTEPGLVEQVARDARDYFDGKGSPPGAFNRGAYFGIVPEDNGAWCKCPRCRAGMDPGQADSGQFSNGLMSTCIWDFISQVAGAVRTTHPDQWISGLAYYQYAYRPAGLELEPNIAVQMCLHTRNWWAPYLAANDRRIFDEWVAESEGKRPLFLWLYYNFPAYLAPREHFKVFPGFFVHTAIEQMAMYHRAGIRGIFMEHSAEGGQSFLHDQLDLYVTLKLADDPDLDGTALVDEFFTRYYGAAAEPMRALYLAIEETYSTPGNYSPEVQNTDVHFHQTEEMAWGWLGTEERMQRFGEWMQQARAAAQTDVEKQRVDQFDRGIWQYMEAGRRDWLSRAEGETRR